MTRSNRKTNKNQATPPPTFLGVHMKCCNVYTRANLNAAKDAFVGWCPKCTKQVQIRIAKEGETGSTSRFFEAS